MSHFMIFLILGFGCFIKYFETVRLKVIVKEDINTTCIPKSSTGKNRFIIDPKEFDKEWKLPFRNASKIWKEFVPWIDKPVNITQLPEIVQKTIKIYIHNGEFNVHYKRKHPCWILKPVDLFCKLKQSIDFRTIKYGDGPFTGSEWKGWIPEKEFNEILPRYKTCAVVSSSSGLKNLKLGKEIDRHEAVLRFNFAPTQGYEKDVGAKTTIRVINSLAFYKHYKIFIGISTDEEIIFHFDPSKYRVNLYSWYTHPQFPYFPLYKKHRAAHPNQTFFLIDPRGLWDMWDFIQDYSGDEIEKTITSSGFMGSIIMMNLCDITHIYGYLPSPTSVTKKCYYFKDIEDMTCTYGGYHPELYEKNIIVQIKQGEYDDVAQWGRVSLPGLNDLHCED